MTRAMTNSASELASLSDAPMPTEAAESEVFVFPVSFAQQRLWFLEQMNPDSGQHNMATAVCLRGIVQTPALEQSLDYLTARHESLRTTFQIVADDLMQVVHPQGQVRLAVVDGAGMPADQWQQWLVTAAQRPFDLAQGPLLRVTLLQITPTEHVLLLVMHHIISDGWSLNILVQELVTTYAAVTAGQTPTFSELPIQYADFAVWQRDWLEQGERDRQLQYWQQQLQDLDSLPLATDFPRPAIATGNGARQTWTISADLTCGLKQLSQQSQATLYMTLLAAWQTLLYRYSGQDDIAVGSPVANRNQAETQGLIGCFVNTLLLRSGLEEQLTFRQLLAQVKATVLAAYEHQDLPFETLVETLQPERDLSRNSLFQVWFALNHAPAENLEISGLTWNSLPLARSTTQFDLSLEVVDQEQTLVATLGYSADLFQNETITRLWHHFQILLTGILEKPDAAVAHLPLLTATERHQLLIDWNSTEVEYPEACLHQLLQQQATRIPAAIAVRFADQILTYQALEQQANQLAHTLQTQGVQPGTLVGLCVERSPALLVGLLGILKAGAAYVPLDPMYPPERLAGMVSDAQILVLVTQQRWLSLFETGAPGQMAAICLDRDQALIAQAPIEPPLTVVTPDHLAYVIYTSGSTGKPKGVQISHRAIVNFLHSMAQTPGLTATDRLLAVTTLAFDIAGLELFLPLWVGAQVVIAPQALITDGERLAAYLYEAAITVMQATPATWRLLLAAGWQGQSDLKLLCGGEALTADLAEQLLNRGAELWNVYGPTETTVWSTVHRVETITPTIAIGRAIANTHLYVLDQQRQPVPIGVPGELYIGGAGLAQGYLHRPDLTAEKFVPHLFANSLEAKLYRTGDLVRYRTDGTLECLGRLDHQVKLRGFRIELGEIESLLSCHPQVQAAVVTLQTAAEHKRLVAYIVPASQPEDWTDETGDRWLQSHLLALQQYLKAQLPYYMVPSGFVALAQLPLTPNGKVDRRSLPAPGCLAAPSEAETAVPQTPIEQILVQIWAEVLGLPHVGIHDNFFALGGDSILSIQIVTRANQVGLPLTPKLLFQHQTIAELATVATATPSTQPQQGLGENVKIDQAALDQAMARSQAAQRQAQDAVSIYPLSPMQQGLLFHLLYHPGSEAYLNQTWGTLVGPLNITAFQQAWQQVVDPHAILRTAFVWEQLDAPLQVVYRQVTVPFEQQDWRHLSADEQKQQWQAWLQRDRQQGFDPDQAPLMRVTLIQLADNRYQFVWSHHHLLLDGWSTPLLLKDVLLSYAAYSQQQVPQLPPSPDYGEYIAWLQERSLEQADSFWRQTLQDFVQPTPLPTGQPPATQTQNSAYAEFEVKLPAETTAALQAWSRQYKITLNTLMQGCWALLLGYGSDRQDIVFGATVSGRPPDLPGADTMIGLFINTLPVRVQISAEMPLLEWLQALQAQQVEARQYEYSPLAQIQRWSQVPQGRPLFNSVLVFENFPTGSDRQPDLLGVQIQAVQSAIRNHYPLTLRVAPQDPISLLWMYDPHQISTPIVQHRAQQLVTLLQSIAEQPQTLIQNLLQVLQHSDQQAQTAKAQTLDQVSRTTFQQTRRKAISAS